MKFLLRAKAYDPKGHRVMVYDKEIEASHDGSIRSAGAIAIERMMSHVADSQALVPNSVERIEVEILHPIR